MKRRIGLGLLFVAAVLVVGLISGCEDSLQFPTTTTVTPITISTTTTSTTTTTVAVSSDLVNKSKAGAMFASSGNGMASVASSSQAPTISSASALDVSATGGPPDTFYATLTDSNGYVTVEGFHASETVKVRYIMKGGSAVTPLFLSTKAIAILGDFDWDSMFTGSGTSPSLAQVTSFISAQTYSTLESITNYMNWAWTAGLVEAGFRVGGASIPASLHFTNPTPEASEQVSTMEGVVTLANDVTGIMTMNISVKSEDDYGMPTSATGSGTIEVGGVTLDATMEVTFTSSGANESLSVTGTTSDNHTVTINCIADGSGTGTIKNNTGTIVATMEISASGTVTVTDSDGNQSSYNL